MAESAVPNLIKVGLEERAAESSIAIRSCHQEAKVGGGYTCPRYKAQVCELLTKYQFVDSHLSPHPIWLGRIIISVQLYYLMKSMIRLTLLLPKSSVFHVLAASKPIPYRCKAAGSSTLDAIVGIGKRIRCENKIFQDGRLKPAFLLGCTRS
ncbi:unnamed protein product [Citrullus colocynthis]|uniref:Uncharacterized protein n=1 Tax=Citrullus colocynthis TaxID=252529 RepID=A0ABP0Z2U5_9ROSI